MRCALNSLRYPLVRFGNPANSESPVALRPLLAKGLPFVVGHQIGYRTAITISRSLRRLNGRAWC